MWEVSSSRAVEKEPINRQGNKIRIFVTGVGGQLGHDVVNDAVGRGHEAIGYCREV